MEAKIYNRTLETKDILNLELPSDDELISLGCDIDFEHCQKLVRDAKDQDIPPESIDVALAHKLHEAITKSKINESYYFDMRFWQWVCLHPMSEYVHWRWSIDLENKPSHYRRFVGHGGTGGFSKNALARIFIPAYVLLKEDDGKDLLDSLFEKTQKELSIFQNECAINSHILVAMIRATLNKNTSETKRIIIRLNVLKSGICFDLMPQDEIVKLISINSDNA
jgi:hypothetical protein